MSNKPKREEDPRLSPEVILDFDGILRALQTTGPISLRPREDRFQKFLEGVQEADVRIGPCISNKVFQGEMQTGTMLRMFGLDTVYADESNIHCVGELQRPKSVGFNQVKAARTVERAKACVVGVVGSTSALGKEMLRQLKVVEATPEPIVLGVPSSSRKGFDITPFEKDLKSNKNLEVERNDNLVEESLDGFTVYYTGSGAHFTLSVVMLEPFSYESGQQFGSHLQSFAI